MSKVKLPKEIAALIEEAWAFQTKHPVVVKHLYLTNWSQLTKNHGDHLSETLSDYAESNPMEYMSALVNGYEVVKTPEERVKEYYDEMHDRSWDRDATPGYRAASASEKSGIEKTLNILGIKIEGINA